jgi:hypothetical protein
MSKKVECHELCKDCTQLCKQTKDVKIDRCPHRTTEVLEESHE